MKNPNPIVFIKTSCLIHPNPHKKNNQIIPNFSNTRLNNDMQCFDHLVQSNYCSFPCLMVTGYDTSLKNKLIKKALRKHFSSCGRVREVTDSRFSRGLWLLLPHTTIFPNISSMPKLKTLVFVCWFFTAPVQLWFILWENIRTSRAEKALELGAYST